MQSSRLCRWMAVGGTTSGLLFSSATCSPEQINLVLDTAGALADAINGQQDDDISFWDWLDSELDD